jgi:hypothetical protein
VNVTKRYDLSNGFILSVLLQTLVDLYKQHDIKLRSTLIPFVDSAESVQSSDVEVAFPWEGILHKFRREELILDENGDSCLKVINAGMVQQALYFSRSVEIEDFVSHFNGRMHCMVKLVHFASTSPDILRLALIPANTLTNYQARGITQVRVLCVFFMPISPFFAVIFIAQGGKMEVEPYYEAGLTGKGQICGIADSGLNDLSCFFIDNSNAYPTVTTNRSGVVEPLRRKVIQYTSYADSLEDEGNTVW